MNRPEFTVRHETLAELYFIKNRTETIEHSDIDEEQGLTYTQARNLLLRPDPKIVAHKDFPYHAIDELVADVDMYATPGCRNIVLVRHPVPTLLSAMKLRSEMTSKNFGYADLLRLVTAIDSQSAPVHVVVADDLAGQPGRTIRQVCDYLGIDNDDQYMSWTAGTPAAWKKWQAWHASVAHSTGFDGSPDDLDVTNVPGQYLHLIEEAIPIYETIAGRSRG